MEKLPAPLKKAILVKRINRFVADVILNNAHINVYVPNTGRLSELALPGAELLLSPINAKYRFKVLYIINRSFPVMIDSTYSNRLFLELLKNKMVPFLRNFTLIKSEPVYGSHRFDFLLSGENEEVFIELKSCTLFHNTTGAFPDAVSTRASEHVKALADSGKGKLVFLVLKSTIERFMPNYHTDFEFYETLKKHKDVIDIRALAVQYDAYLKIQSLKEIPVFIPEVKPSGIFVLILFNPADVINDEGEVLEHGYYLYCGKYEDNVFKTISSIKKKNGIRSILPDSRFSEIKIISDLPIITDTITENYIAEKLIEHGGSQFPVSEDDKTSLNKLIYFKTNPAQQSWFWDIILELRFKRYSKT